MYKAPTKKGDFLFETKISKRMGKSGSQQNSKTYDQHRIIIKVIRTSNNRYNKPFKKMKYIVSTKLNYSVKRQLTVSLFQVYSQYILLWNMSKNKRLTGIADNKINPIKTSISSIPFRSLFRYLTQIFHARFSMQV